MIRSKLLLTTAVMASVAVTACDTMATAPSHQTDGPPSVVSVGRSGALHLIADCSQYTGLAGSSCTITSSNLTEIGVGSKVVYASAAGQTSLNSDIALNPPGSVNNAAFGNCSIDLVTGFGQCTFNGGTGNLTKFHASSVAAYPGGNIWYWDGTYSFAP